MFKTDRENYLALLDTMEEIHGEITKAVDADTRLELLTDCQNGAMVIGNALEQDQKEHPAMYGDNQSIVSELEGYCEKIYEISRRESVSSDQTELLGTITNTVRKRIEKMPLRIKVAFFPYKAEMWDALESIYLAAKEDERCDTKVVVVPYQEYREETKSWENRYEGDRFEDVEVTFYGDYDPQKEQPDVAYIHYPYDDQNLVTRLREQFYSRNLKKCVGKLIYTPYYVTGGVMAPDHLRLPVYEYADYLLFQSKQMKESCKEMPYYDKILPFGSPKFDKVIRKCREGGKIPEDWKAFIRGRKTLMLNTSLNQLLTDNAIYLSKLEYLLDYFQKHQEVALIWRPHPLMKSTMISMRPELVERFEKIEERFINEKIGIYDTTPDIENTVAIADGYIGADGSSVVNLFNAAGKPCMILNSNICEPVSEDEQMIPLINGTAIIGNNIYMLPDGINAIFRMPEDGDGQMTLEGILSEEKKWISGFYRMTPRGKRLYMSPNYEQRFACYETDTGNLLTLGEFEEFESLFYFNMIATSTSLIYLSDASTQVWEFVIDRNEWILHKEWIPEMWAGIRKYNFMPNVIGQGYDLKTDRLCLSMGGNRLLVAEVSKKQYRVIQVDDPAARLVVLAAGKEGVWLTDLRNERVIRLASWDTLDRYGTYTEYPVPNDYRYTYPPYTDLTEGPYNRYSSLDIGDYLILFPFYAEQILRLDKKNAKWETIADEFMKEAGKPGTDYHPDQKSCH